MYEIIEVPGLQRCILAIVGETQHLLLLRLEFFSSKVSQYREDEQRGGGAAPLAGEPRQLGEVPGAPVIDRSAARTYKHWRLDEPARH